MTVQEYAAKCGVSAYAVYHAVYAGRIRYMRTDGHIDIPDQPFPPDSRLRSADELLDLPEYILSLIWFTGTISGDAILIRNTDRYHIDTVARHISASTWIRKRPDGRDQYVCKIAGVGLVQALHDLGFTGSKDAGKQPPPVSTLAFAKAFAETHTSFVWQLRYNRRHPGDKRFAYYVPCISSCASPAILEAYADALNVLGIAPTRKVGPASNGTSALLRYTSNAQLRAMHAQLSIALGSGTHTAFWDAFDAHITQPPIPYFVKNEEDQPMGAQYTSAQRAATEKYMEQHTDRMTLRLPKGIKDEWTQAAQAAGMSLTQYIIAAVEAQINQEPEH